MKSYEEILPSASEYRKYAQDLSLITSPTKMVVESHHPKDALTPSLSSLTGISQCLISNHFAMNPWKRQNHRFSRSRYITSFLYESKYEQNKHPDITSIYLRNLMAKVIRKSGSQGGTSDRPELQK
jgi:hypothetical protein